MVLAELLKERYRQEGWEDGFAMGLGIAKLLDAEHNLHYFTKQKPGNNNLNIVYFNARSLLHKHGWVQKYTIPRLLCAGTELTGTDMVVGSLSMCVHVLSLL